jgi:hypothetical protein
MGQSDEKALDLDEVARRLDETGVQWAVFAGAAAAAYGVSRPINDIDILVPAVEGERMAKAFPEAEIERRANGAVWVLSLQGYDILAGLRQIDLDREMGERLRYREIEGVRVPMISVEDNIAIKAMRGHGAAQGKRDWEDVEEMLRAVGAVDWDYLCWRLEQLEPKERVAEVLKRLGVLGVTCHVEAKKQAGYE